MNPVLLAAPAAEATRRPTGDPPGDPPGDFAPEFGAALAQAEEAPGSKGRADGARTATAEGAKPEAADDGSGEADAAASETVPAEAAPAAQTAVPAAATATVAETSPPELVAPAPQGTTKTETEAAPVADTNSVADTAPAVAQQPPVDAATADETPEPDAHAAVTPIKAPPGELREQPASVPADGETRRSVPLKNTAPPQAAAAQIEAQTQAQTEAQAAAAPVLDQPAATEPTSDPAAATGAAAAAAVESKGHSHTSDKREQQQQQSPAGPVLKPQATQDAEPAKASASAEPHVHVKAAAGSEPRIATPVDQPAQPQPVVPTAPQQVSAPERAAATETPVRAHSSLAQLADTARTVVRMAVRDGATQAHITLHPAELGEVSIRLRYHAGGVSADVLTESHAAAQALQGAASELRRSLEAQGLVVHGLDVRAGEHEKQHRANEHHSRGHQRHAHTFDLPDQTTIDTSNLPLPTGAVDVLA